MLRLRGITVGLNSEFSVIALVYTQFHPTEAGKKKIKNIYPWEPFKFE